MTRFRELRVRLGLTQEEFRQSFNDKYGRTYTSAAISQIENGKRMPSLDALKDFSDFYNVPIDYLVEKTSAEQEKLDQDEMKSEVMKNRNMSIGEKISALREICCIQQKELAEKMGIHPVVLNRIERGTRHLRISELETVAKIFDVRFEDFKSSGDEIGSPVTKIPIYGRIVAGYPSEAVEDILGYVHIPKKPHPEEFFALKVRGASMEPTILDGDVVIVHRQPCVDSGKIAVLLINNEDATVKRVFVDDRGITVRADNPAVFQTLYYSEREVQTLPVIILGAVVAMHRDF